jgi:cytochrome c-type biogenesis protein CcmE
MDPAKLDPEVRVLIRCGVTAIVVAAVIAAIPSLSREPVPYKMVEELGDLAAWHHRAAKVHGFVQAGTIVVSPRDPDIFSFLMFREGKQICVIASAPRPDTFKDGSEVVAAGRFMGRDELSSPCVIDAAEVLVADQLYSKCGGKYDGTPRVDQSF